MTSDGREVDVGGSGATANMYMPMHLPASANSGIIIALPSGVALSARTARVWTSRRYSAADRRSIERANS